MTAASTAPEAPAPPVAPAPDRGASRSRFGLEQLRFRWRPTDASQRGEKPPPLSPRLDLARSVLVAVLALTAGLLTQLTVVSSLKQRSEQQRLYDSFRGELAQGTAPTGPTDFDGDIHPPGTPVAYLEIPGIGVRQVVVSGTSGGSLFAGPGHRRDTVLPGQIGVTVLMGRRAAYGGPFGRLGELDEGDRIDVTTGQGAFRYTIMGVRREGDPLPAPPQQGESRLVLTTADGPPFFPSGVLRVDATMAGDAAAGPGRLFGNRALPPTEGTMAGDTSQLWALAMWLQVLLLASSASVWSWHRWGRAQAWLATVPPLLLVGSFVADQFARLLPNML